VSERTTEVNLSETEIVVFVT